ncbi:unnamed protein product [Allacma fusca]|uniref:Uncharacterized protein n=1 Tax=Allacma fusca TaxID=39272 RepID=A0A8J2LLS6_9HEXA|nr:unnamed protein product [Allacma fusca]
MGEADFEPRKEPMNNNVPPSPGSQLPSTTNNGTGLPPLPPQSTAASSGSILLSGGGTLLRQPASQHYFRPIVHHRPPYTGRVHDDFDLTSDSDAISSPTSSIIGPPPVPGVGRPPSPHHLTPLLPCYNNGNSSVPSNNATNPPEMLLLNIGGAGFHGIYSPTGQSGSGPLRFDESSFLGTSDACSSPETGSLPRTSKLTKRKRPPRPPPRRLKTEEYSLPEEDGNIDDDDDPHIRHLIAR